MEQKMLIFPAACHGHNIKSSLSDGISARSWNNTAKLHCFLMIYLRRVQRKGRPLPTSLSEAPETVYQVLHGAISEWRSLTGMWGGTDHLSTNRTQMFHMGETWVKHPWKAGRILLRASKKMCGYLFPSIYFNVMLYNKRISSPGWITLGQWHKLSWTVS